MVADAHFRFNQYFFVLITLIHTYLHVRQLAEDLGAHIALIASASVDLRLDELQPTLLSIVVESCRSHFWFADSRSNRFSSAGRGVNSRASRQCGGSGCRDGSGGVENT